MLVQKDINTLIKEFFDSVYSYTDMVFALQPNKRTKKALAQGIITIHKMQKEIEEIQLLNSRKDKRDRVEDLFYMRIPKENFIVPNTDDFSAYMAFSRVISIIICALQYRDIFDGDAIIEPLTFWYAAISNNFGKDLQMSILVNQNVRTK